MTQSIRSLTMPDAQRARTHIKAIADALTESIKPDDPEHTQLITSGILTGLAMSVQILDGASAEKALENLNTAMDATVGRLLLEGKLSPPKGQS